MLPAVKSVPEGFCPVASPDVLPLPEVFTWRRRLRALLLWATVFSPDSRELWRRWDVLDVATGEVPDVASGEILDVTTGDVPDAVEDEVPEALFRSLEPDGFVVEPRDRPVLPGVDAAAGSMF